MKSRVYRISISGLLMAVLSSGNVWAAGGSADFEKFRIDKLKQPITMDCAQKHGKYLPMISARADAGLQKVAMQMQDHSQHDHSQHDHSQHQMMMSQTGYSVSKVDYTVPAVELTSERGETANIANVLNSDKPVMLNFIFTTCTTICPVLSASFSQVQEVLGDEMGDLEMVSITIDPEYDTVDKLSAYARRFDAGEQWRFFTGNLEDVVSVEKAFDIYRGSKMNHEPITLIRVSSKAPWLRINGLADANDIVTEYRKLITDVD